MENRFRQRSKSDLRTHERGVWQGIKTRGQKVHCPAPFLSAAFHCQLLSLSHQGQLTGAECTLFLPDNSLDFCDALVSILPLKPVFIHVFEATLRGLALSLTEAGGPSQMCPALQSAAEDPPGAAAAPGLTPTSHSVCI